MLGRGRLLPTLDGYEPSACKQAASSVCCEPFCMQAFSMQACSMLSYIDQSNDVLHTYMCIMHAWTRLHHATGMDV